MNKTDIVREAIRRFPKLPDRTIARYILQQHGELFDGDLEKIRGAVRYQTGKSGDKARSRNKHLIKKSNKIIMPATWRKVRNPYKLPPGLWLMLFDVHIPFHEPKAVEAAIKYGQDQGVDGVFLGGDLQDAAAVSFWPATTRRKFNEELELVIDFLDFIEHEFPRAKKVWKPGNHEYRLPRYYQAKAPELIGMPMLSFDVVLALEQRGIEMLDYHQIAMAGKLPIIHGHEFRISSAVSPARGLLLKTKSWAMCGHFHRTSEQPGTNILGTLLTTWSVGCLCHDSETEVLTSDGFKRFDEINNHTLIAEYDQPFRTISYAYPKAIQKNNYHGNLLHFESGRLDQCVTPEHKILFYRKDSVYQFKDSSASEIYKRKRLVDVPTAGYTVSNKTIGDDSRYEKYLAELIGFVITDGSYRERCNSVRIYQKNKYERVKHLLDFLGFVYTEGRSRDIPVFNISSKNGKLIRKINPEKNHISRELLSMRYDLLLRLYEGLISGDGHRKVQRNKDKTTDYFSTHFIETANQFQELCVKIGYSCLIKKIINAKTNLCNRESYIYKCFVRKCDHSTIKYKSLYPYNGYVYDLTTTTGYFIIRRNGKVSVSGNCDLSPDYNPYGNDWNHGVALVNVEKNGDFEVVNKRILKNGKVV